MTETDPGGAEPDRRDRFRGALVGLAVGEALGLALEPEPPRSSAPVAGTAGDGPVGLPAGGRTQATTMALRLAETLLAAGAPDPADPLDRVERTGESASGDGGPDETGSGRLGWLAPVALAHAHDPATALRVAASTAGTAGGAPETADAARCLAAMLVSALDGAGRQAILDGEPLELLDGEPIAPQVAAVVDGSFLDREPPEIRGGGHAAEGLEAALWALGSTTTFEDGVLAAVNLGDEAGTTGAIHGQLAGAIHGIGAIPARWREPLELHDELVRLADELAALGEELGAPGAGRAAEGG